MRDIVLVPSFYRPEYLQLCLQYIRVADGGPEKEIWVAQDRKTNDTGRFSDLESVKAVAERFGARYIERKPHPYIGNVFNFLELYKDAYATDARYVYMVEDDVLVAPDFFRWHQTIQPTDDFFCTVGWHCIRNARVKPSEDPHAYITTYQDFSSIGVCWRREKLEAIVKHAQPAYYQNLGTYLLQRFPDSPVPRGTWTEQAGLITRLLHETKNRQIAWPSLARCFHIGIRGYHRQAGHNFDGDLAFRVRSLEQALASNRINKLSKDPFDDINPPRPLPEWRPALLYVAQHFPYTVGYL